jgi:hypothetical protein
MAIFEQRTYRIKPAMVQDYLKLYHDEAMEVHCRYLGPSLGWFTTDIGGINEIVILWRYESYEDRERRRMALYADPQWLAFLPKTRDYIEHMENKILKPAFFSPLQ